MTTKYKLIIFDVDGTLVKDYNSHELLPGVLEKLSQLDGVAFALASNQGGVGLRHWMESEGFGDPSQYPTEVEVARRIRNIANRIMLRLPDSWCAHYIAFAYQSKKSGKWAPTPEGRECDPRWDWSWRKPGTGMLRQAMLDANAQKHEMLMVGDWAEDSEAASTFGIDFMWAKDFFGLVPDVGKEGAQL